MKNIRRFRAPVVGLTGGIGCGQSSVAKFFKSFGAKVLNADNIGNQLLLIENVKKNIVRRFGKEILNKEGEIDRKILGAVVFSNNRALRKLNAILHPAMIKKICEEVAQNLKSKKYKMIVVDAALLFETGIDYKFDYIVTVFSDLKKRVERIKRRDNLSDSEIKNRINSQIPVEYKVEKSDYV
ncbi:dephospho-CoA kinase, partial [candidate division KSB1 bacterium]